MKELTLIEDEWSYEEDQFVIEKMKLAKFYYKWTKIARHINKIFHQNQIVKTDKQIKRRWLYVLLPLINNEWSRNQAMLFIKISQKYQHSSRRYWNKLKKEFSPYSFKMLKYKYKQFQAMKEAKFIIHHKNLQVNKGTIQKKVDGLSYLCKQLEGFI